MITLYNEKDEKLKLISVFEFNDADMGESSISATVSFDKEQDFHPDWYVVYNGEKFYLGVRKPTGKKDTSSLSTTYTLVFKSEREDLKRYTFMDFVELGTGNPQPSSYNVPLYATLSEFVDRFNTNLRYYLGNRWQMVLPQDYVEDGNAVSVSFDNASLWDVLLRVYEVFGVRWTIHSAGDILQIQVGFQEVEIEHVFEYGKGNGLVSVERNNALERIITRLRGRGSERNLPADYFHTGDPDTNSFLQATFFKNLMPKAYRDYIRGYNAGSGTGSWAYNQGVADRVSGRDISPVDYAISDKEDLWGISYGAIEPNEQIYPTLQGATRNGVRLDEVLSVEQVMVDGVREPQNVIAVGIGPGGQESSSGKCGNSQRNGYLADCRGGIDFTILTDRFQVANPINTAQVRITLAPSYISSEGLPVPVEFGSASTVRSSVELQLVDFAGSATGEIIRTQTITDTDTYLWELDNIPAGDYRFRANVTWSADIPANDREVVVNVDTRLTGATVREYARATDKGEWKETFDIEIRDVWGIARNEGESDEDYTYRVWSPRAVSEDVTVMFSDGLLAGEDYEFSIVGFNSNANDLRQTIITAIKPTSDGGWKLTLQKSDAELEAGNIYLPNTMQNAKAGDHFFFVNISMPYDPYVYDAEERLQAYLDSQLSLKDEEFPSFTITPSKIFCSSFAEADKIQAGAKIRVRNTALVGDSYISLYIQSLTKRYSANSLNPEWSLTISDLVVASGNPVETLQGEVDVLSQRFYNNRSAIQEAVRSLSSTFLRKDGIADVSYSPTEFKKQVTLGEGIADEDFINGDISGKGFGVYTDGEGNRVIEADVLVGRIGARFNEVVINQVTYSAGKQVFSSAGMVVSKVEDAGTSWRCYFDTKNATVRNYFAVGDGAFCQRFVDSGPRQYWARVTAVGSDYIEISKTDRMQGSFDPIVGDNIAQLGNKTDKSRQAALMIDETRDGGGLVTWYDDITDFTLSNKDSVNIGRIDGKTWLQVYGSGYIGDREKTQYVKYENGQLTIKGKLEVGTTLSDGRELEQAIKDATPEGYKEFVEKVLGDLGSLQQQVDGAIDSYFYEYAPTLDNYPANEWDTDAEKEAHLNDTFTNLLDGRSWRWTTAGWVEITDTATTKALAIAGQAKDIADGKRRVFIDTPYPPYDLGDLWAGGSNMPLMRCVVAKDENGVFEESDWDYADNTTKQLAGYEYLKRALGESTTVDGGLVQTSLLMLGYTSNGTFNVMSGTNGLYDSSAKGGGIAAWYGGPMADKEADSTLVEYAQSLFRFDGSGYLAGGNITWDKDGAGSVAGGDIAWDKDGAITLGVGIKISGDTNETLGSILTTVNKFLSWFEEDANGDIYVKPDDSGRGRNFYTYGAVSFGGLGDTSGGGEGGGSGVTSFYAFPEIGVNTSTLANGQVLTYDGEKWINKAIPSGLNADAVWSLLASDTTEQINISHIPDLSSKYLPLSGGAMNTEAYIAWQKGANGNDVTDWDSVNGFGLRIISDGGSSTGTPTQYATALHIMGRYGFQLGTKGGNNDTFYIRKITPSPREWQTLIHSGNIGSQQVEAASTFSLKLSYSSSGVDLNTLNTGGMAINYGSMDKWVNAPEGMLFGAALNLKPNGYNSLQGQLAWDVNHASTTDTTRRLWWRASDNSTFTYAKWHRIAFTDSNVASATKLANKVKLWGNEFDGSADVTGSITLPNNVPINITDTSGVSHRVFRFGTTNELLIGQDAAKVGYNTYIYGNEIRLAYGTTGAISSNTALMVNSSGNVGIGTTAPEYTLDVAGPIRTIGALIADSAKITTNIRVGGDNIYNYIATRTTEGYNNLSIDSYGDKICISGQSNTVLNVNYTKTKSGWAPKTWNWYNGSSTGWANFVLGGITANGEIIIADSTGSSSTSYKLRFLRKTSTDNAYDFGLYAQTTKGLTFFRNLSGTDTDIAYLDNAGNFNATGGITATALTINGVGKVGGNLTTTNIYPSADASYNLGSTSKKWYQVHTQEMYANSGRIYGDLRLQPKDDDYVSHLYFGDSSLCYIAELADDKMTLYAKSGIILTAESTKDDALKINANTYVDGNFITTGGVTFGSDERYKTKLSDVSISLEDIANAPLFNYRWKDRKDNREHLGTTAQYWNKTAFRNAVCPNDEKLWTMSYSEVAMGNTIVLARELLPIKSDVQLLKERVSKLESILREHNINFS